MTDMMQRYEAVIKRLGHAALLDLPDEVKDVLKSTADLETKVKMLEMIEQELALDQPDRRYRGGCERRSRP